MLRMLRALANLALVIIVDWRLFFHCIKDLIESAIFSKHKWASIEEKQNQKAKEVKICSISACFWSAIFCQRVDFTSNEGTYQLGQSIKQAIAVVDFVIQLVIESLIFSFDDVVSDSHSFQHFWDNWDEHKHLEETHECERNRD